MHTSSYEKVGAFVTTYLDDHRHDELRILDVGSQAVEAQTLTYRTLFEQPSWSYTGLDVEAGLNVDIVPAHDYRWDELAADTFDVVVSGQAFEHAPYFWATAFEIGRVLRPGGLAVITAPGRGPQHRYPLDCWRFHDDGFQALADYLDFEVLDVFTEWGRNMWDESILVMRKPVWSTEDRRRFATRLDHQRALTTDGFMPTGGDGEPGSGGSTGAGLGDGVLVETEPPTPTPSPLCDVVGGAFTVRLGELRVQGIKTIARRREAAQPAWRRAIPRRIRRKLADLLMPPPPFSWDPDAP